MIDYKDLATEKRNAGSTDIDVMNTSEVLNLFYQEDMRVVNAVKNESGSIEKTIETVYKSLKSGGRIFYVGAGTSGRLGVLDASEIRPTFGIKSKLFAGIIAGGRQALVRSIEGAEDDRTASVEALKKNGFGASDHDMVIGITASGMTPFVLGALEFAVKSGRPTALLTCNSKVAAEYSGRFGSLIAPDVGSEIISGSTRLKSGTATKMVLNMISTTAMIKLGKVYHNYMVDLTPTCRKLNERALRILGETCGIERGAAEKLMASAGQNVKTAILMHKKKLGLKAARSLLKKSDGMLRRALGE